MAGRLWLSMISRDVAAIQHNVRDDHRNLILILSRTAVLVR